MARYFNLDEARSHIPTLERTIAEAVASKGVYEKTEHFQQALAQRIMVMGGILVDVELVERNKTLREKSGERLKSAVEEIQEIGCIIKDLDAGLVDFPTLLSGEEVYLCWRMGETDIQFWHSVHEGFAGRKEIDEHFMANHQGREPN